MIESVHFKNFKVLRNTTLPLGRFTLIVGPNGSGKTTALEAICALINPGVAQKPERVFSAGVRSSETPSARVEAILGDPFRGSRLGLLWNSAGVETVRHGDNAVPESDLQRALSPARIFSLEATRIAGPVDLAPGIKLEKDGAHLAGVLDALRDRDPEAFEALNRELREWLPEFDRGPLQHSVIGQQGIPVAAQGQWSGDSCARFVAGDASRPYDLDLGTSARPTTHPLSRRARSRHSSPVASAGARCAVSSGVSRELRTRT